MWGFSSVRRGYRLLATFFNIQISRLADRFLMEIEENVNGSEENSCFQRYRLKSEKSCNRKYLPVIAESEYRHFETNEETSGLRICLLELDLNCLFVVPMILHGKYDFP